MIAHTVQPLRIPAQIFGNNLGVKFRNFLRARGGIHVYKRGGKFYTFDVPFQLMMSKHGDKMILMIKKAHLPRAYPPLFLIEARADLEAFVGLPVQIREASDVLAVCCQVPNGKLSGTAA